MISVVLVEMKLKEVEDMRPERSKMSATIERYVNPFSCTGRLQSTLFLAIGITTVTRKDIYNWKYYRIWTYLFIPSLQTNCDSTLKRNLIRVKFGELSFRDWKRLRLLTHDSC